MANAIESLCQSFLLAFKWIFGRIISVIEDGYEPFADRQLVIIFSAPNHCGEFDNSMMSVDETLMCSFQIPKPNLLVELYI